MLILVSSYKIKTLPSKDNPRTGAYKQLVERGLDLHELHALMAPRPFLVSGGTEDRPERWKVLNHAIAANKLLGYEDRVAMTNRRNHSPTPESNEQLYKFFERILNVSMGITTTSSATGGYHPMKKAIQGGGVVTMSAPYKGGWIVALVKK